MRSRWCFMVRGIPLWTHGVALRSTSSEEIIRSYPCVFQKYKKETETLEIMFRSALRCSRPSRSKVRTLISNPQSQYDRWTPPELQDRSVWSPAAQKSRISWDQKLVEEVTGAKWRLAFEGKFGNLEGFRRISRSSSGRCGSYSTVSKYSSVLSNCKIWTESDHWGWR